MTKSQTISYAQNREDIILSGFFSKNLKGFYVDVGAANPVIDSVTKYFYDRGWRGINIEPIGHIHKALKAQRPRDINLNIGISNTKDTIKFREYAADGFSTFAQGVQKDYEKDPNQFTEKYMDYKVDVLPLREVFKQQKVTTINFMKVDVEGFEYEVLEGNDWSKYRPQVICIEANHVKRDWKKTLKDNGYRIDFFDGLNEYYVDSRDTTIPTFSYIDTVINRQPILPYTVANDIEALEAKNHALQAENKHKREHIAMVEAMLTEVQTRLAEVTPLGRHIKRQVKYWTNKSIKKSSK